MFGREELKTYTSSELYDRNSRKFEIGEAYLKEEADKVMDAMETHIKELESIPHTDNTAVIEALQRDKDDLIALNEKRIARIKELEATISKMETTTPKWISVKDVNNRPNEKGDYVLVCDYVNRTRGTAIYQDGKFTLTTCGIAELNITHWMPLPLPPTTEESSSVEKENG